MWAFTRQGKSTETCSWLHHVKCRIHRRIGASPILEIKSPYNSALAALISGEPFQRSHLLHMFWTYFTRALYMHVYSCNFTAVN